MGFCFNVTLNMSRDPPSILMLLALPECSMKRADSGTLVLMMARPWNLYSGIRIYTIKDLIEWGIPGMC